MSCSGIQGWIRATTYKLYLAFRRPLPSGADLGPRGKVLLAKSGVRQGEVIFKEGGGGPYKAMRQQFKRP